VKSSVDRIRWHTRKVNRYSAAQFDYIRGRTDRRPPATRRARLQAYKSALNQLLEAEKREQLW